MTPDDATHIPAVMAAAHLADRAGARDFRIGYDEHPTTGAVYWYCQAQYQQATLRKVGETPAAAAFALAERLLTRATCRCGKPVSMAIPAPARHCGWQLNVARWVPGCTAPPITMPKGTRGNVDAMAEAMAQRKAEGMMGDV